MSAFAKLKANRQAETAKLQEKVKGGDKKSYETDTRYWQLQPDKKTKTGNAIIRFLPATPSDDAPFVTLYEHAFQRQGGWYIEKSRSTLGKGEKDPVLEYNEKLWKSGNVADRVWVSGDDSKGIKGSKRKQYFISNIYVVKHDAQPEDEGKVFLFKYGIKIKKMIDALLVPEDEGEDTPDPVDVFDMWEGANFSFKMTRQGNYANYDTSKFLKQSALLGGDDDKLEEVYNSAYSLAAEIAPDKFKSYDELQRQLTRALGGVSQAAQVGRSQTDEDDADFGVSAPKSNGRAKPSFSDDDDDDAFFSKMKTSNKSSVSEDDDSIPF